MENKSYDLIKNHSDVMDKPGVKQAHKEVETGWLKQTNKWLHLGSV